MKLRQTILYRPVNYQINQQRVRLAPKKRNEPYLSQSFICIRTNVFLIQHKWKSLGHLTYCFIEVTNLNKVTLLRKITSSYEYRDNCCPVTYQSRTEGSRDIALLIRDPALERVGGSTTPRPFNLLPRTHCIGPVNITTFYYYSLIIT